MFEEHYTSVIRTDDVTLSSCCLHTNAQPDKEQKFT